jgi:hypothetical protein
MHGRSVELEKVWSPVKECGNEKQSPEIGWDKYERFR